MTLNLNISNFRCWENKKITIPNNGIVLINGKSGRGKSTILNSILYCITGKGKNISTFGKKSSKIELSIDDLKITRSRGPNRLLVEKNDKVYEDDEAQCIIDNTFGQEFNNVSYIDQDNINSFVFLSPSDKIEFLEKLLLGKYDIEKIKDDIKNHITKSKTEYTSCESKMDTFLEVLKTMTYIDKNILFVEKVNITQLNFQKIYDKIKNNLDISTSNYRKIIPSKIKKLEEEFCVFSKNNEERGTLRFIIDDLKKQIEEYMNIENDYKNIKSFEEYKESYKKYKEFVENKEKYSEYQKKYIELSTKNQKDVSDLEKSLEKLQKPDKNRSKEFLKCKDYINNISELEKKLDNNSRDFDSEIKEILDEVEKTNKDIQKNDFLLKDYEQSKECYKCPSCNKLLKFENSKRNLIVYEKSLEDNKDNIDVNEIKKDNEKLKKHIKMLENKVDLTKKDKIIYEKNEKDYNEMFDKLEKQLEMLNVDIDSVDNILEETEKNDKEYERLDREILYLKNDKMLSKLENDIERMKNIIDNYNSNNTNDVNICKTEEDYIITIEKISKIKEDYKKYKNLLEKLEISKEKYKNLIENEDENKDYEKMILVEKEKLEEYSKKVDKYTQIIKNMENWQKIETENKKYSEIEQNVESLKKKKEELNDKIRCLIKLREHVKNAERKSISDFIDSLNEHASIYIEHFFPDEDILVTLKTIQESKTSGKEKICLNFEVTYRNMIGDMSFLSGGERDRVNLAFTLAFSELVDNRILMLDECISSLDYETSNKVVETLKEKYKGKLILCVAHQVNTGFFDTILNI